MVNKIVALGITTPFYFDNGSLPESDYEAVVQELAAHYFISS